MVLGGRAYFNCHARGDHVYWQINGRDARPRSAYEALGFTFHDVEIPRSRSELEEHNNTIIVEARLSNNNTRISCTAVGTVANQRDIEEGTIFIAGMCARVYMW